VVDIERTNVYLVWLGENAEMSLEPGFADGSLKRTGPKKILRKQLTFRLELGIIEGCRGKATLTAD
jgi:hypothetical protein